jgi:hypothetical protein
MIVVSSLSIGYAYQLLFILYCGKPAIFCCSFPNLFVYCQRLCFFGLIYLRLLRCYKSNVAHAVHLEKLLEFLRRVVYGTKHITKILKENM